MSDTLQQKQNEFGTLAQWIAPESRILDLGCGDGTLLKHLQQTRNTFGYGLEIDDANIATCISNGVNVIQLDLNNGLAGFEANSFDYVIMTQALQVMEHPDLLLDEMLRVGREGIVTFPNFGHWSHRWQLTLRGQMPVSECLPNSWYNTPNIHLCTLRDFEALCRAKNIRILQRCVVNNEHKSGIAIKLLPNLFGEVAVYRIQRG